MYTLQQYSIRTLTAIAPPFLYPQQMKALYKGERVRVATIIEISLNMKQNRNLRCINFVLL